MSSLNYINYLNAAASFIMVLFSLNVDAGPGFDFFNMLSTRDLPRRFEQGAMTPADPFFILFNITALFLGVFAILQLLPTYRASPIVQEGVSFYYVLATLAQVIGFGIGGDKMDENFLRALFSTLLFGVMTACSIKVLNNQANSASDGSSEEYWMIRFPLSLFAGWSIALVIMSANVLFEMGTIMHVVILILSLLAYTLVPIKLLLLNGNTPNYVVPAFLTLITFGIGMNASVDNATWETTLLMFSMYLISFISAVGTGFLVYTKEYKPSLEENEAPLAENQYEGAEMTATKEDAAVAVV